MKYCIEAKNEWQECPLGLPLRPLEIKVRHENGEPVHNLPVRFKLAAGDGHFTHRDALTDVTGCAIAEFVPRIPGPYFINCGIGDRKDKQTYQTVRFAGDVIATDAATAEAGDVPTAAEPTAETAEMPVEPPVEGLGTELGDDIVIEFTPPADAAAATAIDEAAPGETEPTAGIEVVSGVSPVEFQPAAEPVQITTATETPEATAAPATEAPAETAPAAEATAAPPPRPATEKTETVFFNPDRSATAPAKPAKYGRIALAVLAVLVAIGLFVLARHDRNEPAPAKPVLVQPKSVDCTGSAVKQVGKKYVFENCVVKY
jgi:hypothetical protein